MVTSPLSNMPTMGERALYPVNPAKLVLFCDFDGPIVDVSERYYATYQRALTHIQDLYQHNAPGAFLQPLSKGEFWRLKQDRVCDVEIAMRSGLQEEQIEHFLNYVYSIVNDADLLHKDRLQPGVHWALALLHSLGVKLVLVTLRHQEQATAILAHYGLKRLFTDIYGTQDEHAAYPNSSHLKLALLEQAIAKHGQGPTTQIMVGDTEADVYAAQGTGIPAIALTCGIRSPHYLQQFQPDLVLTDLLTTAQLIAGGRCFLA